MADTLMAIISVYYKQIKYTVLSSWIPGFRYERTESTTKIGCDLCPPYGKHDVLCERRWSWTGHEMSRLGAWMMIENEASKETWMEFPCRVNEKWLMGKEDWCWESCLQVTRSGIQEDWRYKVNEYFYGICPGGTAKRSSTTYLNNKGHKRLYK